MAKRRNEDSQMSREEWEQREAAADRGRLPSGGRDAGVQRASDADATASPAEAASTMESNMPPPPSLLELLEPAKVLIKSFVSLTKVRDGPNGLPGVATMETSYDMRHLIELLTVAVLLDATLVPAMVRAFWFPSYSSDEPTSVSKIEFELTVADPLSIESALTDTFLTAPSTESYFPECEAVREELLRRVEEAGKTEALLQLRVPVVCTVSWSYMKKKPRETFGSSLDSDDDDLDALLLHRVTDADFYESIRTPDQVQSFFRQVVDMGQRVILSGIYQAVPWVQFTFTKMQLKLYASIPITPDVVRAAQELSQHSFVSVLDATVDPRMVHCSTSELSSYLRALSRHSPKFHVRTGYFPHRNAMTRVDADGEDKKELIVKMMTALASCSRLRSVDLGDSTLLLTQPRNRLHYWQALLEILLAPESAADALLTPRGEFSLDMSAELKEEDALLIQQIPEVASRPRRRIDCFELYPPSAKLEASAIAVVSLVRDMEKLKIGKPWELVPAAIVPGVLRVSAKVRSIWLLQAAIPSLAVFIDPTMSASGRCLEEIVLFWPRLMTQSSWTVLLTELLDPSTPLSSSLRELTISPYATYQVRPESVIDAKNAELLERVLCVNRRLERIYVPAAADTPPVVVEALRSHNGDPVWGFSLLPATEMRRRCAFLSFVRNVKTLRQLDATLVRIIFDFDLPFLGRRVVNSSVI